ncbi:MAG: hypothetical protein J5584_08525 [Clostridia bacterium]|nr:hypothetical protein [Clostridia bacterium]
MAVAGMRHISCIGLMRDKAKILDMLQKEGAVHFASPAEAVLPKNDVAEGEINAETEDIVIPEPESLLSDNTAFIALNEKRAKLQNCIEELARYDTRKKHLFSFLRPVKASEVAEVDSRADIILAEADKIIVTDAAIKDAEAEIARLDSEILAMSPWAALPYAPSEYETAHTATDFLAAGSRKEYEEFKAEFAKSISPSDICVLNEDKNGGTVSFAVTYLKPERAAAEKYYNSARVTRFDFSAMTYTPAARLDELSELKQQKQNEITELTENRKAAAQHLSDFEILYDSLGMRVQKMLADVNISDSSVTFNFDGWVPAKQEKKISAALTDEFICNVAFRDPAEGELPPTKLENGILGGSIEPVESLYSLLQYGQLDPSAIAAFFYALFFGFMFSDAGYGILLTVACAIILIKCKLKASMKKYIWLFLFSGISTIFWGVLFGSWFGNVVQTVTLGKFALKPLWFDPQDSVNTEHFLAFTLLLGVIHLYTALAMKAANLIAKGKWLDAICDVFFWYIFYTGEILFLLPYIPYYKDTAFCAKAHPYAVYLLLAGFVLILFTKGRKSRNPFIKLFGGITCLYSLVDMLSDCLSYTRLMAMGLATSVIINVFNSIAASAAGLDTAGITFRFIIFIVIFVAANLFNFAINALGAYVNACRLTYIEFFGKFYEGDGKEYDPLCYNTEYITVEPGDSADELGAVS